MNGLQGFLSPAPLAGFRSSLSAAQTGIAHLVVTKVNFNTEAFDLGDVFNTSNARYTPRAGVPYSMAVGLECQGLSPSTGYVMLIMKNGGEILRATGASNLGGVIYANAAFIDSPNGTDYYEVFIYGSTGTTFQVNVSNNTFFSATQGIR